MALYTIRIFKSWGGRYPDRRWVNNYEVDSSVTGVAGLSAAAGAIAAAEKIIHLDLVNFLSATVSTWEPDGVPYNPDSFTTLELSGTGSRATASQQSIDSNVALKVNFQPTTGRSGRRFYRGCLIETDVVGLGDLSFTFEAASPVADSGSAMASFKTAMAPYLAGGADPTKIVLAYSGAGSGSVVRGVASLKAAGISINRRNHRYFDRAFG